MCFMQANKLHFSLIILLYFLPFCVYICVCVRACVCRSCLRMQPCFTMYTRCVCTIGSCFIRFLFLSLPVSYTIAWYLADSAGHLQRMCYGDCDICSREVGHSSAAKRSVSAPCMCHYPFYKKCRLGIRTEYLEAQAPNRRTIFTTRENVSIKMVNSRREYNEQKARAEEKPDQIGSRLEIFRSEYIVRLAQQTDLLTNHIYSLVALRPILGSMIFDHQLCLVPVKLFRVSYISWLIFLHKHYDINSPPLQSSEMPQLLPCWCGSFTQKTVVRTEGCSA